MRSLIRNNVKGFTLVEMLVIVAFITIVSAPIASMFVFSSNTNASSRDMLQATYVAQRAMEEVIELANDNDYYRVVANRNYNNPPGSHTPLLRPKWALFEMNTLTVLPSTLPPIKYRRDYIVDNIEYTVILTFHTMVSDWGQNQKPVKTIVSVYRKDDVNREKILAQMENRIIFKGVELP